jgi:transposase
LPCGSRGRPEWSQTDWEEGGVLEEAHDSEELIERVAALDIGKAQLVCCVRVPGQGKRARRLQEVKAYPTMTRSLLALADRLAGLGVTRVVMEATSDYWKSPYYLLEAHGFEVWLVNAHDVKHLPGRPKTDRLDAVWLCKVAERQMLPAKLRAATADPPAAGPDPLPRRPGRGQDRREAAGRKAARGTPRSNARWSPATSSGSPAEPCSLR